MTSDAAPTTTGPLRCSIPAIRSHRMGTPDEPCTSRVQYLLDGSRVCEFHASERLRFMRDDQVAGQLAELRALAESGDPATAAVAQATVDYLRLVQTSRATTPPRRAR